MINFELVANQMWSRKPTVGFAQPLACGPSDSFSAMSRYWTQLVVLKLLLNITYTHWRTYF